MALRIIPALIALALVAACSTADAQRTIDGTTPETFQASVRTIHEQLDEQEREQFEAAFRVIALETVGGVRGMMQRGFAGEEQPSEDEMMRRTREELHGMTREEVLARAKEIAEANGR